jgi:hypothetical protein
MLAYAALGCALFAAVWFLLVDVLALWRFRFLPSLTVVITQLFQHPPTPRISLAHAGAL